MAKTGIGVMRRITAVTAIVLGIALTGFGATVENVRGSQRENSNLVDIYYDLNATDGGTYTVEVAIEGRTSEVTATTFSDNVDEGVAPGKNRHILWEADLDWRGNKGDVMVTITATKGIKEKGGKHDKVQLWDSHRSLQLRSPARQPSDAFAAFLSSDSHATATATQYRL